MRRTAGTTFILLLLFATAALATPHAIPTDRTIDSAGDGDTATLVATVTNGVLAEGTIVFMDGGTELGSATLHDGVASLDVPLSSLHSRDITAVYHGAASASHQPTVNVALVVPTFSPKVLAALGALLCVVAIAALKR